MIMKMHSYMTVAGHMQTTRAKADAVHKDLQALVHELYPADSWEDAIHLAQATRHEKERLEDQALSLSSSGISTPREGTPLPPTQGNGSVTSYVDAATASALRQRLKAVTEDHPKANVGSGHPLKQVYSSDSEQTQGSDSSVNENGKNVIVNATQQAVDPTLASFVVPTRPPPPPHPLVHHPNPKIAGLAEEYSELLAELRSSGPVEYTQWPDNVTWKNFAVYQLIPTLVYELEYPRTTRIRPLYVFEKTVRHPSFRFVIHSLSLL